MSFQNTENETSNRPAHHSSYCLRYSTSRNHLSYRSFCPADISWVIQLTLNFEKISSSSPISLLTPREMTPSSSSLPIRGASPAAIGIATAGISGSKAAALNASIQAISTAGNMNKLMDTIPSRYRLLLAPILQEM